eukprot:CAMPEP_0173105658 /NCGR_PEP_ID=MMETSP1102-20130122/40302_1 /TAXON_ID=49646 /ORGANISM="Geminigera sp., Strain Caron Lab Isolate" /LENGTH=77 /DNA_ID=CAMNT_0014002077 /DNA_START=122 /DNA_END=355 /DNA_ORIENTATION=+
MFTGGLTRRRKAICGILKAAEAGTQKSALHLAPPSRKFGGPSPVSARAGCRNGPSLQSADGICAADSGSPAIFEHAG